jgi:hypothetical protein
MPEGWNGYIDLYPETDHQTQLFRDGKLDGVARPLADATYCPEMNTTLQSYHFFDAGGQRRDTLPPSTHREAMISILNNYKLP